MVARRAETTKIGSVHDQRGDAKRQSPEPHRDQVFACGRIAWSFPFGRIAFSDWALVFDGINLRCSRPLGFDPSRKVWRQMNLLAAVKDRLDFVPCDRLACHAASPIAGSSSRARSR